MDFSEHFPKADRGGLQLLRRLLAFDPAERPTAEEALADPYFHGLHSPAREPVAQPINKMTFEFERRKLSIEEVRELIYREILEYHPQMLSDYLNGGRMSAFAYPSAVDNFKRQFMHLESTGNMMYRPRISQSTSLPRERVGDFQHEAAKYSRGQSSVEDRDQDCLRKHHVHQVDALGSCVRGMSVVDHCGPVPVAYGAYPHNQTVMRSNNYMH